MPEETPKVTSQKIEVANTLKKSKGILDRVGVTQFFNRHPNIKKGIDIARSPNVGVIIGIASALIGFVTPIGPVIAGISLGVIITGYTIATVRKATRLQNLNERKMLEASLEESLYNEKEKQNTLRNSRGS